MSERTKMYMMISEINLKEKLISSLGEKIYLSKQVAEKIPRYFIDNGLASFAKEMSENNPKEAVAIYEYEPLKIDVVFIFKSESDDRKVFVRLEEEIGVF